MTKINSMICKMCRDIHLWTKTMVASQLKKFVIQKRKLGSAHVTLRPSHLRHPPSEPNKNCTTEKRLQTCSHQSMPIVGYRTIEYLTCLAAHTKHVSNIQLCTRQQWEIRQSIPTKTCQRIIARPLLGHALKVVRGCKAHLRWPIS